MKKTFRHISTHWLPGILLAVGLATACQQTDSQMDDLIDGTSKQTKEDIAFISSLGYDVGSIEKSGDGYLVEGDIWLTCEWLADARKQPQTRLTQHNQGTLVKKDYWDKLYLDPYSLSNTLFFWLNPTTDAVNQWNNLNRATCRIAISIIAGDGFQEIKIKFAGKSTFDNSTAKLMKVTPPSFDGKPGSVTINQDCAYLPRMEATSDAATKNKAMYTIMHAIGHALGLGHTPGYDPSGTYDEDWGGQIDKTMDLDNKSIMRREANPLPWSGFSAQDKIDIPKVFPKEGPPQPQAFAPGSIEKNRILNQIVGTFSIASVSDATGGSGEITYAWEKKTGSGWVGVPGKTGKNLTDAPAPAELTTEYRRKATDGIDVGYSNVCIVTNNAYKPMTPGEIVKSVTIDTDNTAEQLTVNSVTDAFCARDEITYIWEVKQGNSWTTIPSAAGATLVTDAPTRFMSVYRRRADCAHAASRYSNECTVYNLAFLDGGEIPELVEINKIGIHHVLIIPSLRHQTIPGAQYAWSISRDGHPIALRNYSNGSGENLISGENLRSGETTNGRIFQLKRSLTYQHKTVWSNECTLINHAFEEDPRTGSGFDNMIDLGTYDRDFTVMQTVDTRGEYFRDQDRAAQGGNDAFMSLKLTRRMTVHITTGATICFVRLEVMDDSGVEYFDISSTPFSAKWGLQDDYPFILIDETNPAAETVTLDLLPGKYTLVIQGSEAYNGRYKNHVLGIRLRGEVQPGH